MDVDSAVFVVSRFVMTFGFGFFFTVANRFDLLRRNAQKSHTFFDGFRSLLTKGQVVFTSAAFVGVAFQTNVQVLVSSQKLSVSATLRSLNSFSRLQEMSGLKEKAGDRFVALDSPFNHCEQGKIVIPRMRVEPSIDNEEQHIAEMAAFFRKQVESKKHLGMLVLFASGRAMQRFLDYVTDLRLMLLVQGDQPRYRLVELHRKRVANGERSVLVGLQSFAEGLDLKGDLLSQVHIHKIAFPPIDSPVVITEGEWLKSLNRYPFEVQSLPSASFNLIQQVGRLIRSHGCWGEVVIYDKRLLTKNYGKRLLDALPVFPIEQPEVPEGIVKKKEKTKSPRRRRR